MTARDGGNVDIAGSIYRPTDKQRAAQAALKWVRADTVIGLSTGSSADCFIEALAKKYQQENLPIQVVASSWVSMIKAQQLSLPLVAIENIQQLDLYVDGADEVAPDNTLLKGQGSDLVKEKLLANASRQFIVLIDESKRVQRIGDKFPIPIEVMPFAWQIVKKQLESLGASGELRRQGNGLALSSHGSLILDMTFPTEYDSEKIDQLLNTQPGVVEHGIFRNLASYVLLAKDEAAQKILPQP